MYSPSSTLKECTEQPEDASPHCPGPSCLSRSAPSDQPSLTLDFNSVGPGSSGNGPRTIESPYTTSADPPTSGSTSSSSTEIVDVNVLPRPRDTPHVPILCPINQTHAFPVQNLLASAQEEAANVPIFRFHQDIPAGDVVDPMASVVQDPRWHQDQFFEVRQPAHLGIRGRDAALEIEDNEFNLFHGMDHGQHENITQVPVGQNRAPIGPQLLPEVQVDVAPLPGVPHWAPAGAAVGNENVFAPFMQGAQGEGFPAPGQATAPLINPILGGPHWRSVGEHANMHAPQGQLFAPAQPVNPALEGAPDEIADYEFDQFHAIGYEFPLQLEIVPQAPALEEPQPAHLEPVGVAVPHDFAPLVHQGDQNDVYPHWGDAAAAPLLHVLPVDPDHINSEMLLRVAEEAQRLSEIFHRNAVYLEYVSHELHNYCRNANENNGPGLGNGN